MNPQAFRSVVERSPDLILVLSAEGTIRYANRSAHDLLGVKEADIPGRRLDEFVHPEDYQAAQYFVAGNGADSKMRQVLRIQQSNGNWIYLDSVATNGLDDPLINGLVINGRDATEHVVLQRRLSYEALHDPLTGLANRVLFHENTMRALSTAGGELDTVAVMLLDLDRFKSINDTFGHEMGDEVLRVVAARLLTATRGSDTVARLGGDQFALLLTGLGHRNDVLPVIERVTAMLQRPVRLENRDIFTTASIGIAISAQGSEASELVRHADVAMYAAKADGRTISVQFFEPEMKAALYKRGQLEIDLRSAIAGNQLRLVYQPLIELGSGKPYGIEALVRWDHPTEGTMAPHRFIPVAEESGLIIEIGRWVLNTACQAVTTWTKPGGASATLLLSVNLSARQLMDEHVVDDVANALASSGLDAQNLVLELTESVLFENTTTVMHRLSQLRSLGVKLAIDDFGTGYSSLSYLSTFPIDILKIDRRFVSDLDVGGSSAALAKAVLGLGKTLSLRTVAEGIETQSQLAELQTLGCEFGQGFLFAHPLSSDDLEQFLTGSR